MRNAEGRYVLTRLMGLYNTQLVGVGDTKEEAKAQLKNEVRKYRDAVKAGSYLQETGETRRSPGDVYVRSNQGGVVIQSDPNRKVKIKARPAIADYILKGRK